jgi:hypothetical protein
MYYSSVQAAGTKLTLKDSSDNMIAEYTPAKQYASVAISTPGIQKGQNYSLYSGDTKVVSFTVSDTVTYLNESGITTNQSRGPGGFGGANGGTGPDGGGKHGWGAPPNGAIPGGGQAGSGSTGNSTGSGSDVTSSATVNQPGGTTGN